jgi:para-aminobenzoate synthetase/4-amino-4-deoxychorismate lyase
MRALFPSGSVTGAPKIRAMEILRELEGEDRRIYTGTIGYITPERDMYFNIPIRTLLIEDGKGEMGIGGGIVWDSTPEGEWAEGLLKARFFSELFIKLLK